MPGRVGVRVASDVVFPLIHLSHKFLQGFLQLVRLLARRLIYASVLLEPLLAVLLLVVQKKTFFVSFLIDVVAQFGDFRLDVVKLVIESLVV